METVRRWDFGEVGRVERTDQGYLRAPATITKTGVFAYRQRDGTTRRELRLPEEVFHADAMKSFGLAPLVNGHPRKPNGEPIMLNAQNTARYQVGSVVEPRQDGDHVAAYIQVTDADTITDAEQGRRHLSCGYQAKLEFNPGVTSGIPGIEDGQRYDAIQRHIRGNHVALVDRGRAGSTVQLRLDSADALQVDEQNRTIEPQPGAEEKGRVDGRPRETTMQNLRIDGVTFEVSSQVAEAVGKTMARLDELDAKLAEAQKKASEQQARADQAEENLAAEKQARADATTPDKIRDAVHARLSLERTAGPILGDEVKVDGMTDAEIKRAVVLQLAADKTVATKRLDAGDDAYLAARYDAALESYKPEPEVNQGLAGVKQAGSSPHTDAEDSARERMLQHNRDIGRKGLKAAG